MECMRCNARVEETRTILLCVDDVAHKGSLCSECGWRFFADIRAWTWFFDETERRHVGSRSTVHAPSVVHTTPIPVPSRPVIAAEKAQQLTLLPRREEVFGDLSTVDLEPIHRAVKQYRMPPRLRADLLEQNIDPTDVYIALAGSDASGSDRNARFASSSTWVTVDLTTNTITNAGRISRD